MSLAGGVFQKNRFVQQTIGFVRGANVAMLGGAGVGGVFHGQYAVARGIALRRARGRVLDRGVA